MAELTINEALIWQKTLQQRHAELMQLRNENSHAVTRRFGMAGDKDITTTPTYSVKHLDRTVSRIAMELRKLDMAIKSTNAVTVVKNYNQDDAILGELEEATA